jgi:hypothetical protein
VLVGVGGFKGQPFERFRGVVERCTHAGEEEGLIPSRDVDGAWEGIIRADGSDDHKFHHVIRSVKILEEAPSKPEPRQQERTPMPKVEMKIRRTDDPIAPGEFVRFRAREDDEWRFGTVTNQVGFPHGLRASARHPGAFYGDILIDGDREPTFFEKVFVHLAHPDERPEVQAELLRTQVERPTVPEAMELEQMLVHMLHASSFFGPRPMAVLRAAVMVKMASCRDCPRELSAFLDGRIRYIDGYTSRTHGLIPKEALGLGERRTEFLNAKDKLQSIDTHVMRYEARGETSVVMDDKTLSACHEQLDWLLDVSRRTPQLERYTSIRHHDDDSGERELDAMRRWLTRPLHTTSREE